MSTTNKPLFDALVAKSSLKQEIYAKTLSVFNEFKEQTQILTTDYHNTITRTKWPIPFEYSAIKYTINFDLLTPPYDNMKEVTVMEMQTTIDNLQMRTGKRLGFRFQADDV